MHQIHSKQFMLESSNRLVYFTSAVAVAAAFVMVVIKVSAWYFTQSVVMLGALLDSLMDGLMSVFIFFSLRYAMQPADKEHRFGHGKAEAIAAFLQGLILIAAAAFLCWQAVSNIYEPHPISNIQFGIIASAVCILITFGLVTLQSYTIRKTGSLALRADRLHYRMDMFLYFSVILALFLTQFFQNSRIDAFFGAAIGIYIAYEASSILIDAIKQLMDHELPNETRDQIKAIIAQHAQVLGIHDLRTRMSGRNQVIQFHIEMAGHLSLIEAHHISDQVEARLLKQFPDADVIIHQDPEGVEHHSSLEKS